jgi:hypothetical protein
MAGSIFFWGVFMGKFLSFFLITSSLTLFAQSELGIQHHVVPTETPQWIQNASPRQLFQQQGGWDGFREGVDWNEIVNIGKRIWQVIEANKPVVNVSYLYANALPKGARAEDLDNFSDIQDKSFHAYGTNYLGMTVYDVVYTVVHRYNGSYKGRGKYLENVSVIPSHVQVAWGYTLDLDVTKTATVNVGTSSRPVASLALELTLKTHTVMKSDESRSLFQFRGDSKDFKKM